MRGKVLFTRGAAKKNVVVKGLPEYRHESGAVRDISVLVQQYSQLIVKGGWQVISQQGVVYARTADRGLKQDAMEAVGGDGSPLSYVQAASCYHHLSDYTKKGSCLSEASILDDSLVRNLDLFKEWSFGQVHRSLNPVFFYDSLLHPVVILFSHHKEGIETIQKSIHRFERQGYALKFQQRNWAVQNRGDEFPKYYN
ncbi:hypothetical protein SAMN05216353_12025 [Halobacillus alkaliphilus]|uniref:Uncharacterized protein n=1 Tax=Halobacillus alkaliphilus TaxID=396056 RepID=A0A1I2NRJ5_9BACI|nr:hypothetical protein [Halobacillus alkaliphilus]SFG04257.1 hypothetical protein SAMN05216353_12025 [Halobacillus alkaliphilus]